MKHYCQIFLAIFSLLSFDVKSQALKAEYCLYDNFKTVNNFDSSNFETYNPRIGLTLVGNSDSIFSFVIGKVIQINAYNNYSNIKIKTEDHYIIIINLLKKVTIKTDDSIHRGQFIGLTNRHGEISTCWIIIYHDEKLLTRSDINEYLKKTCDY